jgi:hypothetical protein
MSVNSVIGQDGGRKEGERERGEKHTSPSNNPSPVVAQLGVTNQILSFSSLSLSASVTSWGFIATDHNSARNPETRVRRSLPPGTSCLLANTSSNDSFISRSLMMRCNSCLASSMRALSEESITKMRPCVPVFQMSVLFFYPFPSRLHPLFSKHPAQTHQCPPITSRE